MASNQFNIGRDSTISIVGPAGPVEDLGLLEEFEARPKTTMLNSLPINNGGIPVHRNTYQGWEGSFSYARKNGNLDLLHNILESNFFAGNPDLQFQITEVIRNPDGTVDRYIYVDCHLALETAGRSVQNDKRAQRFAFNCAQRVGA